MFDGRSILLTATLLCGLAVLAQQVEREPRRAGPAHREPWQWTLEERIAHRTDAVRARDRVREAGARQEQRRLAANASTPARLADHIIGRAHPELFLPHEVFRTLIEIGYLSGPRSRQWAEEGYRADLRGRGLPDDFWRRLEVIAASYISDVRESERLSNAAFEQKGFAGQQIEKASLAQMKEVCRSRAAALVAAREEFGREAFDRFLYEVIAPGKFHITDRLPTAEELRAAEDGCR